MYECHAGKWIMLKGRHFISLLICSVYELFSINFPRRVNLIWLQGKTHLLNVFHLLTSIKD